jgi:hypothetical protein
MAIRHEEGASVRLSRQDMAGFALGLRGLERLEGQGRFRPLDPLNIEEAFLDEMPHIVALRDVELQQQIEGARGGIKLGMDFAQGDFLGHAVGLAGLAADIHEDGAHGDLSLAGNVQLIAKSGE